MAKRYRVRLSITERKALQSIVTKRNGLATQVKRAYMLLAADEAGEKSWKDEQISATYQVSVRSIERVRQRYVEEGWETAVNGKPREVFKEKRLDGVVEAQLIALRCSSPPKGRMRWTLPRLADQMVELEYVETLSHESVRQILKKTNLNLGESNLG